MEQLNIFSVNFGCPGCGNELEYGFSCTYNNIRMCIQCAYDNSKVGSPVRMQFEKHYKQELNILEVKQ